MPRSHPEGNGASTSETKKKGGPKAALLHRPRGRSPKTKAALGPLRARVGGRPPDASVPVPAGGAVRVPAPVAGAAGARVGLGAGALQVGVLDAGIALGLVARGVDEFVQALGFVQHGRPRVGW